MAQITQERRLTIQLWIACVLIIVGIGLLIAGFVVDPRGEIHSSVLVAFGEVMTFAGALIGVDYHYGYKRYIDEADRRDCDNEDNQRKEDNNEINGEFHA